MGMCSDAPDYPKAEMRAQIEASEKLGNRYLDLSEQQQTWAQDQWNQTYELLQGVLGAQTDTMNEQLANARKDRARYEERFQPLEDDLIAEFRDYDSPERRALESGRAQATAQQAYDAQRANAEARLESYGIDPSQTRGQAIDAASRVQLAAQQAAQGNLARDQVEQVGRALRADAINIGRGLPSQVAQSYGQTLQAGQGAMGAQTGAVQSGANTMGTGLQWGSQAGNQIGRTMGGINDMYSGQLAGFNAGNAGMQMLGQAAGTALGAWAGGGFEDGGSVPGDAQPPGPTDVIDAKLAPGEYVIPANVVRRKGTDFFDKLRDKADEQDQMDGQQQADTAIQMAGIPTSPRPAQGLPVAPVSEPRRQAMQTMAA